MSSAIPVRLIDRDGQRFGAGLSAIALTASIALDQPLLVALIGLALAIGSAFGTRFFAFGRPWPTVRRVLGLGRRSRLEPELGPRFAQALGATFVAISLLMLALGLRPWAWGPAIAVAALQALLATTGFCLGCRLYGFHWWLPAIFDRVVLRRPYDAAVHRGGRIGR